MTLRGSTMSLIERLLQEASGGVQVPDVTLPSFVPGKYAAAITRAAKQRGTDPLLVAAVARNESNFNPAAKSPTSNAAGMMQIIPGWHPQVDPARLYDAEYAIDQGAGILARYTAQFGGDPLKGAAAYRAGPEPVKAAIQNFGSRWMEGLDPDVQNYVQRVAEVVRPQRTALPTSTPEPSGSLVASLLADANLPPPPPPPGKSGVIAQSVKGGETLLSQVRTAIESVVGSPEEAARGGLSRQEDIDRRYADEVSLQKIKDKYNQEGLLSAAGEVAHQIPLGIAEQAANIGVSMAGGAAGAMAGAATPIPGGALIGGALGAFIPSFAQQFGGNVERQAQVQQSTGQPLDISVGRAAGAAAPQALLDVGGTAAILGRRIVGGLLGKTGAELLARGDAAALKLADEALITTLIKGTAVGAAAEIPTEVSQQILERWQAGLPLTTEDALKEYGETAYQVSLLSPVGAGGRLFDRAGARRSLRVNANPVAPDVTEAIVPAVEAMPAPPAEPPPPPQTDAERMFTGDLTGGVPNEMIPDSIRRMEQRAAAAERSGSPAGREVAVRLRAQIAALRNRHTPLLGYNPPIGPTTGAGFAFVPTQGDLFQSDESVPPGGPMPTQPELDQSAPEAYQRPGYEVDTTSPQWLASTLEKIDSTLRPQGFRIAVQDDGSTGVVKIPKPRKNAKKQPSEVDFAAVAPFSLSPELKNMVEARAQTDQLLAGPTTADTEQGDLFTGMPPEGATPRGERRPRVAPQVGVDLQVSSRGQEPGLAGYRVTATWDDGAQQTLEVEDQTSAETLATAFEAMQPRPTVRMVPIRTPGGVITEGQAKPVLQSRGDLGGTLGTKDAPTAEPVTDLLGQIDELKAGRRKGVYLSIDNIRQLRKTGQYDRIRNLGVPLTNFDGKGGLMLTLDRQSAEEAVRLKESGAPMQAVLGTLTGAGMGKPAGPSVAIQRVADDGAVVQERVIPAGDVAAYQAAAQELQATGPGKIRVVTLEQALNRRARMSAREREMPIREALTVSQQRREKVRQDRMAAELQTELQNSFKHLAQAKHLEDLRALIPGKTREQFGEALLLYARDLGVEEKKRMRGEYYSPQDVIIEKRYRRKDKSKVVTADIARQDQYRRLFGEYVYNADLAINAATVDDRNAAAADRDRAAEQMDALLQIHKKTPMSAFIAAEGAKLAPQAAKQLQEKTHPQQAVDEEIQTIVTSKPVVHKTEVASSDISQAAGGTELVGKAAADRPMEEGSKSTATVATSIVSDANVRESEKASPARAALAFNREAYGKLYPEARKQVETLLQAMDPSTQVGHDSSLMVGQWLTDMRDAFLDAAARGGLNSFKIRRLAQRLGLLNEQYRSLNTSIGAYYGRHTGMSVEERAKSGGALINPMFETYGKLINALERRNAVALARAEKLPVPSSTVLVEKYDQLKKDIKELREEYDVLKQDSILKPEKEARFEAVVKEIASKIEQLITVSNKQNELNRKAIDNQVGKAIKAPWYRELTKKMAAEQKLIDSLRSQLKSEVEERIQVMTPKRGKLADDARKYVAMEVRKIMTDAARFDARIDTVGFFYSLSKGPEQFRLWLRENTRERGPELLGDWTRETLKKQDETFLNVLYLHALGKQMNQRVNDTQLQKIISGIVETGTEKGRKFISTDLQSGSNRYFGLHDFIRMYKELRPQMAVPQALPIEQFLETTEPAQKISMILRMQEVAKHVTAGKSLAGAGLTRQAQVRRSDVDANERKVVRAPKKEGGVYDYRSLARATVLSQTALEEKASQRTARRLKTEVKQKQLNEVLDRADKFISRIQNENSAIFRAIDALDEKNPAARTKMKLFHGLAFFRNIVDFAKAFNQTLKSPTAVWNDEAIKTVNLLIDDLTRYMGYDPVAFAEALNDLMDAEMQSQLYRATHPGPRGTLVPELKGILTKEGSEDAIEQRLQQVREQNIAMIRAQHWLDNTAYRDFMSPILQKYAHAILTGRRGSYQPTAAERPIIDLVMDGWKNDPKLKNQLYKPIHEVLTKNGYYDPDVVLERAAQDKYGRSPKEDQDTEESPYISPMELGDADVHTSIAARAISDALDLKGIPPSLHEILGRLDFLLPKDHFYRDLSELSRLLKSKYEDVIVVWDRRQGRRLENWQPNQTGKTIWTLDPDTGKQSRVIVLRREWFAEQRDKGLDPSGALVHTFLHEANHVATRGEIENNPALKAEVRQVMDAVEEHSRAVGAELRTTGTMYGMTNEAEFVSEVHSNPRFRNVLRKVMMPDPNNRGGFVNALRRMWQIFKQALGIATDDVKVQSALDKILSLTDELFTGANVNLMSRQSDSAALNIDAAKEYSSQVLDRMANTNAAVKAAREQASKLADKGEALDSLKLSALTIRQMLRFYADEFYDAAGNNPFVKYIRLFFERNAASNKLLYAVQPIHKLWTKLKESNVEMSDRVAELRVAASMHEINPDAEFPDASWTEEQREAAPNGHLKETQRDAYNKLRAAYNELSDEGKKLYAQLGEFFTRSIEEPSALTVMNAIRGYMMAHKFYTAESFDKQYVPKSNEELVKLVKDKKLDTVQGIIDEFGDKFIKDNSKTKLDERYDMEALRAIVAIGKQMKVMNGPYTPFIRFGDKIVTVYRPVEYKTFSKKEDRTAYINKLEGEDPTLQFTTDENVPGTFGLKVVEVEVHRRESTTEANAIRDELLKKYGTGTTVDSHGNTRPIVSDVMLTREFVGGTPVVPTSHHLSVIIGWLNKDGPNPAATAAVTHFYLQSLEQNSFRKRQMLRQNVAGGTAKYGPLAGMRLTVDPTQQQRTLMQYARGAAYYTAQLRYGHQLASALADTAKVAEQNPLKRRSTVELQRIYKELARHDEMTTNPDHISELVRGVAEFNQLWLLASPSYWAINSTQPWTIFLPWIAGRSSWGEGFAALGAAQKILAHPLVEEAGGTWGGLRAFSKRGRSSLEKAFSVVDSVVERVKKQPDGERLATMIEMLKDQGLIDIALPTEFRELAAGVESSLWARTMDASRIMAHLTEVNNRLLTAIAAYRIQYQGLVNKGQTSEDAHRAAVDFAALAVDSTQLDMSAANTPRLFSARTSQLRPLIFQFMKYTQGMYALFIEHALMAYRDTGIGRKAALKVLRGFFLTHFVAGGMLAAILQPLKWAVGLAIAMLGGWDDEDETIANILKGETFDRNWRRVADELFGTELGRLISFGAPGLVGANISNRVQAGQIYQIDIRTDTPEAFWGSVASSFGGAWTAQLDNLVLGMEHINNGEVWKGIEANMPKGFKDISKAMRYAGVAGGSGLTDMTGKIIMKPEEFNPGQLFLQTMGLQPLEVTEKYGARRAVMEARKYRGEERTSLMREFYKAKDPSEVTDVRAKIVDFNRRQPLYRITASQLLKGREAWRKAQQNIGRYGVNVSKREQALIKEVAGPYQYDEETEQ